MMTVITAKFRMSRKSHLRTRKEEETRAELSSCRDVYWHAIQVLHEAEGHIVTWEMNTGEVYRGKLIEAEDNMNCQMSNIAVTYRDGRVAQLEQVYIHGSKIRFLILPDVLKNAPMLKSTKNKPKAQGRSGKGC
ncbi:hypothetical protein E2I00_016489 [Balaenoptera physalus]|uniref:Small nuclear ribonucleoprotein Sm D3 n=1 Tax=Balaenoptera physalus TaxID=9770 RepID=A0A6A1Q5G1_BALPH|nr:hypothetical protein E2I00_016489 [Balaenoptera physalus]